MLLANLCYIGKVIVKPLLFLLLCLGWQGSQVYESWETFTPNITCFTVSTRNLVRPIPGRGAHKLWQCLAARWRLCRVRNRKLERPRLNCQQCMLSQMIWAGTQVFEQVSSVIYRCNLFIYTKLNQSTDIVYCILLFSL